MADSNPTRPVLYPRQLVIMLDDETADRIAADAVERREPKSVVARGYLAAGIAAADAAQLASEAGS